MSVTNGFFTSEDGEVVRLSAVIMVEPMQGNNGGSYYEVIAYSGHITVKDTYYSRANFLAAWQAT